MAKEAQTSIPHLFRCPISLDLFTDPVTLTTGQTYDRPSIEQWLAAGNSTCPVTMQNLAGGATTSLVPNHTLRLLIHRWLLPAACRRNSHHDAGAASGISVSLSILKSCLQSSDALSPAKLEALTKVQILSTESDVGRSLLIQMGFFPILLQIVFRPPWPENMEVAELALDCLLRLSPPTLVNSLCFLKQDAAFSSMALLLEQGSAKIKTGICLLLETATDEDLCFLLGKSRRVMMVLISFLQSREQSQAAEAAAGIIDAVCSAEATDRVNAVRDGAVEALVSFLSMGVRRNAARALAAMEVLMGTEIGRKTAARGGAVKVMVQWVFKVPAGDEGSEHAVGALTAVCSGSARARAEAVAAGGVMQALLLLQSQCSVGTRGKAMALLKVLRGCGGRESGKPDLQHGN
ncbi:U-box domain-containing protein 25 [Apostasia shenzhenica]|uniref:U-box domain-containing protein n=1 Tax=Apostasia shenzhenica TaxID=1088818 RepID=A0A2I0AG91_9ASPA|nr:U-box domain-containing protein 25 [Apostasia shenzhenica]